MGSRDKWYIRRKSAHIYNEILKKSTDRQNSGSRNWLTKGARRNFSRHRVYKTSNITFIYVFFCHQPVWPDLSSPAINHHPVTVSLYIYFKYRYLPNNAHTIAASRNCTICVPLLIFRRIIYNTFCRTYFLFFSHQHTWPWWTPGVPIGSS